jgi:NAD-dependent SIR2 family protein deacetylase
MGLVGNEFGSVQVMDLHGSIDRVVCMDCKLKTSRR